MAQKKSLNPKVESVSPQPKIEYKGNEVVTAEQQQTYAELLADMKADPRLGKLMLAPEWLKINAILSYLILKELEKK